MNHSHALALPDLLDHQRLVWQSVQTSNHTCGPGQGGRGITARSRLVSPPDSEPVIIKLQELAPEGLQY